MAKGYWITTYKSISDMSKVEAYAKLAGPAIEAQGGVYLARGVAVATYEACLLYTSPSPRDLSTSRMPSSA